MELGIIGNCQYNALIDRCGRVRWLCWPRFDSSFVFGGLLDEDLGGEFAVHAALNGQDALEGKQSYLYNSNILRTEYANERGSFEVLDFAPRFGQYDRYYKPTMLIRMIRPLSGEPSARVVCKPRYDYGRKALTPVLGSNHIQFEGADQRLRLTTNASLSMVRAGLPFVVSRPIYLVLTWGPPLESDLETTCESFLKKTLSYWQTWVKHSYIPKDYQKEVIRSALVLKLHQFEDTGAIIASSTTSLPEEEGSTRNWDYRYCWLRDAQFSLAALQRLTHFEEMEGFVEYLRNVIEQARERLQPVYGVDGEAELIEHQIHLAGYRGHKPVRVGNQAYEHLQHDVYGEMILAISPLFMDQRFPVQQDGGPRRLLDKLLDQVERYMEAADAGLWEFRGTAQVHTFTVLMHWAGAKKALEIGRIQKDEALCLRATRLVQAAEGLMEGRLWDERLELYTQAADTSALDASLLMLVNLGYLSAAHPRVHKQLDALRKGLSAPNGLIHRYVHEDDFGCSKNAFTICCFWLAEALARVGRREEARTLFEQLLSASNHLGLYSEDLDPKTFEQWGNFPQTYSHVGLINAAFALSDPWEP